MNKKKHIFIPIGLLLIVIGFFCLYTISRKTPSIKNSDVEATIQSGTLITSFLDNEKQANTKYLNKVIEVQGTIKDINFLNDRHTIVLSNGYKDHYILCDLSIDQLELSKNLKKGQKIRVKGVCKGYLKDVILLQCILLPN